MAQLLTSVGNLIGFYELSVQSIASLIASSAIIFGGIVPYVPQYIDIKKTRNSEGFSTFVCLTLLIANTLRILFWFGHQYEYPLLLQSIIMIATMLAMVQICTSVKNKSEIIASKPRVFSDFDRRHFWQWTQFSSYLEFMGVFTAITGLVTYLLVDVVVYVELLGFMAVLFEAMLGAPQFYRNFQNKSTKGMSVKMVIMWTSGDVFKTVYFIVKQSPVQFWICGMLQISLDLMILGQVYYYTSEKPNRI